jgi:hypothetical protein
MSKGVVIGGILLVATVVALMFAGGQKRPAWMDYPVGREKAVRDFMLAVGAGEDADLHEAYKLLAPSVKHPQDRDDEPNYHQVFVEVNKYLSGEFGKGWVGDMTVNPSTDDPDLVEVHVGVETLHVRVEQETPAAVAASYNTRYGIVGINEFDVADAQAFQAMEARMGVIRGVAGDAAVRNLQGILAAAGNGGRNQHETRMQTKLRLLPNLRDPRSVYRRTVLETWVVRKDPVIRRRLEMITQDGRYARDVQESAKAVLQDNVPEEELDAISVDPDARG